ncbi:serine/threonine-protein kinase [Candidatus Zixiibacteriota bacterium]
MKLIKLRNATWEYNPSTPLGPAGGFGEVFLGRGEKGEEVAVKKLHISATSSGNREFVISEELIDKNLSHVIPYYDYGIDADTLEYFLVMAKAERSLQQLIDNRGILETKAIAILTDIAQGLKEVGNIVHRDLKPGNVLYHENKWKLADFGIARFVEASTSANTLKDFLSKLYAAPEQWRLERATKSTDIYAFGCIAYELLAGEPPFTSGDLRQRHMSEEPPEIPGSSGMRQLIHLCLRKNPKARPSVESIIKQLEILGKSDSLHRGIASAGADVAAEIAKKEAESTRKLMEQENRRQLADDAIKSLDFIIETMFQTIEREAQVAKRISQRKITLGKGALSIDILFPMLPKDAFPNSKMNIICGALISVVQATLHDYGGRSANLWFREFSSEEFRWCEIAYFVWATERPYSIDPFGISTQNQIIDADYAAAPISHTVGQANKPVPIDGENLNAFIDRWLSRLAAASRNMLQRPGRLPE